MHKEQFAAKWRQIRGQVKAQWGKLTDDDLTQIEGNYDMLVGQIEEKYGLAREEIERQLDALLSEAPAAEAAPASAAPGRKAR